MNPHALQRHVGGADEGVGLEAELTEGELALGDEVVFTARTQEPVFTVVRSETRAGIA